MTCIQYWIPSPTLFHTFAILPHVFITIKQFFHTLTVLKNQSGRDLILAPIPSFLDYEYGSPNLASTYRNSYAVTVPSGVFASATTLIVLLYKYMANKKPHQKIDRVLR